MKDITGQKFGRLTAIARADGRHWLFRCACGTEKLINAAEVKRGNTKSCGCLLRDHIAAMADRRRLDITGQTFGRLTAVRHVTGRQWLFRCACGTERVINAYNVRSGHTRSCGCLNRETAAAMGRRTSASLAALTGQRFGFLTALCYDHTSSRGAMWRFLCDCGTSVVVCAKDIRYGGRRSCGCQARSRHERQDLKKRPRAEHGEAVFDGLSLEQLADLAAQCGVDGPADGVVAFARQIRVAVLASDGQVAVKTVLWDER
jgi:hypothetical protein